jgi:hypothetical protein
LVEEDVTAPVPGRVAEVTRDVALLDRVDVVVVKNDPPLARLDDGDVMTVVRADADVNDDRPQLVQSIRVGDVVGGVEEAELEGENDAVG